MKEIYCVVYGKYRKFKNHKLWYIFDKTLVLLLFAVGAIMKMKTILKKKNQLKY